MYAAAAVVIFVQNIYVVTAKLADSCDTESCLFVVKKSSEAEKYFINIPQALKKQATDFSYS